MVYIILLHVRTYPLIYTLKPWPHYKVVKLTSSPASWMICLSKLGINMGPSHSGSCYTTRLEWIDFSNLIANQANNGQSTQLSGCLPFLCTALLTLLRHYIISYSFLCYLNPGCTSYASTPLDWNYLAEKFFAFSNDEVNEPSFFLYPIQTQWHRLKPWWGPICMDH